MQLHQQQLEHKYHTISAKFTKIQNLENRRATNRMICHYCHKGFDEAENFNWSCVTHKRGKWGGDKDGVELWWCCGKTSKYAKGCITRKHKHKVSDSISSDSGNGCKNDDEEGFKILRCACCKKIGHEISECPKDPNLRSMKN
jgi:hypothetical protein